MKKKIFAIVSVVIVAVLYYFSISGLKGAENKQTSVSSTANDTFTNCIFNSPYSDIISWGKPQLNIDSNINRYNELNFNSIQWYDCGSNKYGTPDTLTSDQINNFKGVLKTVKDGNLKGFYERSFIGKYAYGQRLIYEVSPMNDGMEVNNGFVYLYNMNDTYGMDSGRTVLHATPGVQNSGYLCKNIYENLQHSDLFDFRQNDKGTWYIKPVMRIPDTTSSSRKVVRIDMINFNGVLIDSIIIKASNFRDLYGNYSGNYIEKYNLPFGNYLEISGDDTNTTSLNYGKTTDWTGWDTTCKVDFRVFWYGECEVWFDKMIVDDKIADYMFNPSNQGKIGARIQQEVTNFNDAQGNYSFFVDEICMSQYPCIKYIVDTMRHYSPDSKLSIAVTNYLHIHGLKNDGLSYQVYLDSIKPNFLQADHHGFYTDEGTSSYNGIKIPNVFPSTQYNNQIPASWFSSTTEYNNKLQNNVFGSNTDVVSKNEIGTLIYEINKTRASINGSYPNTKFIMQPQIHGWIFTDTTTGNYSNGLREPTNEEIQAQAMLSIAHGADGLCWFVYNSHKWKTESDKAKQYMLGLLDPENDTAKRILNDYGQNKWAYVSSMNEKILKWLPVIAKTNWAESFSVHNQNANHNYINDIRSKVPYINGLNPCADYGGSSEYFDCTEERYWEQGFYNPKDQSDKSKYFLMVNRRCIPPTQTAVGEVRTLRIKFNTLPDFNNWILKDINTGQQITFDKNNIGQGGYLNLGEDTSDIGYFKPGEGKMFQLAPVMQEGGTLAGDESVSGSFNCNGKVLNNGHNLTISPGATITFSDTAGIEMNGGVFTCGLNSYNVSPVTLKGMDNATINTWNGLILSNCSSIEIYNTNISKITADTAKAVMISNCNNINISNTSFNMGSNAGAIQAVFTSNSEVAVTFNIISCNFDMGTSSYSAISIISNASSSLPVIIDWCNFSTTNENANAITLSGVTGGAIKNNKFTNFASTINTLTSAIDLYSNTILGRTNSTGVFCVDGSSISLSQTSGLYLGGFNYIRNYGGSSSNICSDNSLFNINNGGNNFDLNETAGSKHLSGNFSGFPYSYVNAMKNCFHKDSITNIEAVHSVVWYDNSSVNFIFPDYICDLTPPENFQLFVYNGYLDTVYRSSGGESGGINPNKTINTEENTYKSLKDTISINLRKRNYLTVEEKAKQLLTQYPDSLESATMVQKLYMASLSLDSTKIGLTKAFLENIIVTNTQNPTLIKRAFYFIQKCKVKLKQYQSALDGFQYIMTQNPYTYEGLVASWDYAATYLLMGTGGSYKGDQKDVYEQTTEELNTPVDTLLNRMTKRAINTSINTNKNKNNNTNNNTTEQITKTFYEKIKNVTKDDKSTQEAKVKTLEEKIETTKNKTEKNDAVNKLATMKQIKEAVKVKKPNTVMKHIQIMNDDIKKVFGVGKGGNRESSNGLIPKTYTLYQNYPNPFNPTTKIAYDIPKDAKVKLVIYDILGREVKTLVNNEFKTAGKYITEFNGSYLASGIYFARILVNEGKEFMAVKKLVLLK